MTLVSYEELPENYIQHGREEGKITMDMSGGSLISAGLMPSLNIWSLMASLNDVIDFDFRIIRLSLLLDRPGGGPPGGSPALESTSSRKLTIDCFEALLWFSSMALCSSLRLNDLFIVEIPKHLSCAGHYLHLSPPSSSETLEPPGDPPGKEPCPKSLSCAAHAYILPPTDIPPLRSHPHTPTLDASRILRGAGLTLKPEARAREQY